MAFALSARAPVAAPAVRAVRAGSSARPAVAPARRAGLVPVRRAPLPSLIVVDAKKSVGDLKKADLEGKVVLVRFDLMQERP